MASLHISDMTDLGVTNKRQILMSLTNLLRMHSISLSLSPTKMSNQTISNTNSWGMPFLTHLYLNTKLLPATLASCFLWSPIETYVKSLCLKFKDKYVLWDSVACFASILIEGSVAPPYSPAVYPLQQTATFFWYNLPLVSLIISLFSVLA